MENYQLLVDFFKDLHRQGPGSDEETKKALQLSNIDCNVPLKIADIGCGTGASTLLLAELTNAHITAVDIMDEFLEILEKSAEEKGLSERITTLNCSMGQLPFDDEEFDLIWSEGAIYNIGFENGIKDWRRYLKSGGILAVSEITWTTNSRPEAIQDYWQNAYSEIGTASSKIRVLEDNGYSLIGNFILPEYCWMDNFYNSMQDNFKSFLDRNANSEEAKDLIQAEETEMKFFNKYKDFYSYGFYVARKL